MSYLHDSSTRNPAIRRSIPAADSSPDLQAGTKTDLVLLHGVNNTANGWKPMLDALGTNRTAWVPNLPARTSMSELAASLLPDLPDRYILIGHSLGGYVALELLRMAPGKAAALVLVNSSASADTAAAAQARMASVERARNGEYVEMANRATAVSYHPDNLARADLLQSRSEAVAAYGPDRFMAHQQAAASRSDQRPMLAQAGIPVLVVAASDDRVILAEQQRELALIAGADYRVIDRAGHMLPAEQPQALAETITSWLTQRGL